jgi:hypothetical protein
LSESVLRLSNLLIEETRHARGHRLSAPLQGLLRAAPLNPRRWQFSA